MCACMAHAWCRFGGRKLSPVSVGMLQLGDKRGFYGLTILWLFHSFIPPYLQSMWREYIKNWLFIAGTTPYIGTDTTRKACTGTTHMENRNNQHRVHIFEPTLLNISNISGVFSRRNVLDNCRSRSHRTPWPARQPSEGSSYTARGLHCVTRVMLLLLTQQ